MTLGKDLVAATAEPLVLSILRQKESYGYAIIKEVEGLSKGQIQWTDGMLYPVLHRLEQNGLVKSIWRKTESGRDRKYYRISTKGLKRLESSLALWDLASSTIALARGAHG